MTLLLTDFIQSRLYISLALRGGYLVLFVLFSCIVVQGHLRHPGDIRG